MKQSTKVANAYKNYHVNEIKSRKSFHKLGGGGGTGL